jgi:hypothetical protein
MGDPAHATSGNADRRANVVPVVTHKGETLTSHHAPMRYIGSFLAILLINLFGNTSFAGDRSVTLAHDGKPSLQIVVSAHATPPVRAAADTLAKYLGQISDAKFEVAVGNGKSGIVVGLAVDFPDVLPKKSLDGKEPTGREDYRLETHPSGIYLLGATELAVEHAVWDLLYRFGYRQFFPGADWEVVPHTRELELNAVADEHPAYHARRIWYGFGAWDFGGKPYADWCARNRATSGIDLRSGHSYDGIIHTNQAEFAAHPEYLGLVGGKRTSTKFCISNPGLRKLCVDNALRHFAKDPSADSISMDPSDGGGWCECAECAKLGSITDRAIFLANEVAEGVNAKYPGKFVGLYAYNFHSPPPNIQVSPHVIISVATAFIKGGQSIDELLAGWSKKTASIGIREYYSVNTWDRDLPGAARGGNIEYLNRTIPEFHARGARFLSAESSDNWGPNGLGYYLASRMMWDVSEAQHADVLIEDFLARAFGPGKEPMREFYHQLDSSQPHLVRADQLGRMFQSIAAAQKLADTPAIHNRLNDLLLYCRYVDLYEVYARSNGSARQQAFEALIRHAYRMRKTLLVHTLALYRDLGGRDKSVHVPPEAKWNVAEGKNPWKSSAPFTAEELAQFLAEGIERNPLTKLDFNPIAYGDDLIGASPLKLPDAPAGIYGGGRGKQTFYTRVDKLPATIDMSITGGLIAHYRDRGNVHLQLWKIGGASQSGEAETLAAEDRSVPPDGKEHAVSLAVKEPGLYKLILSDGMDRTAMRWNSALPLTIKSTLDEPMNSHYANWQLYFYVPKGTKILGLFGGERGEVHDAAGRSVFNFEGRKRNYYSINVPDGQDGKLWSIRRGTGPVRLLTVPPCFAPSAAGLLLPKEVVAKDAAR